MVEPSHGELIAEVLTAVAVLVVRYLTYGKGQNLTASQVLSLLHDGGPARISVLAAATGVSQPSMTELVGRLEREGLVSRLCDPDDGRATLVDITASGRAQRLQLQRLVQGRVVELLEGLSDDDQATLSLAMRVAAPHIERLTELAASRMESQSPR